MINKLILRLTPIPILLGFSASHKTVAQENPNIILFMVDDMGWQDTSVPFWDEETPLNRRYNTPNMERLAGKGVRFTRAYASAVSSPTRCSLISGMNATSHHVTNWTLGYNQVTDYSSNIFEVAPWRVNGVQPDTVTTAHSTHRSTPVTTFPQILRNNGYHTIHCGKAHFGSAGTPGADPLNMGFDVNIAGSEIGGLASYLASENFGSGRFHVTGLEKYHGLDIFLTECLTIEAIEAMKKPIEEKKPFFLYMAHYAVHIPFNKDKRFYDKYLGKHDELLNAPLNHNEACFASLIEGMDKSLGDILNFIEGDSLVAANTIVLFMSDNGGYANPDRQGKPFTQNYPLKAGKGSCMEGGIREPMIAYIPGITIGGSKNDTPIIIEDFFPTVIELSGIKKYKTRQKVDGKSFANLLKGEKDSKKRTLYWHYPNLWTNINNREYGYSPYSMIMEGEYKYIYYWETGERLLFNVKEDIGENNNLVHGEPQKAKQLARKLGKRLRDSQSPRPIFKPNGKPYPWPDEIEYRH